MTPQKMVFGVDVAHGGKTTIVAAIAREHGYEIIDMKVIEDHVVIDEAIHLNPEMMLPRPTFPMKAARKNPKPHSHLIPQAPRSPRKER